MAKLTLQMRKDGVSEHCRHLCCLDSESIFQIKLLRKLAVRFISALQSLTPESCSGLHSCLILSWSRCEVCFYSTAHTHAHTLRTLTQSLSAPSLTFSPPTHRQCTCPHQTVFLWRNRSVTNSWIFSLAVLWNFTVFFYFRCSSLK